MIETLAAYVLYLNCPGVQGAVSKNSIINRIQTQQNNGDALANIIENRFNTICNIKNNSENIGRQHNKIPNFFGTPDNYRNHLLFGKCFTALFNSMRADSTDKCVFRYRQSNVRQILPASDYCRARGNQIKSSSTVQKTKSEAGRSRRTFD